MERRRVTLKRIKSTGVGVFGVLDTGSFHCATLERPEGIDHPCIPLGEYDVDWTETHPRHNPCYEVMRVPGRTAILIHAANWYQELLGCIAPGARIEEVVDQDGKHLGLAGKSQMGVSSSGPALRALCDDLHRLPFRLIITKEEA